PDLARLRSNRSHQRYLEFQRRRAEAFFQSRLNGQPHAAIEQRSREAAMHGAGWIEKVVTRFGGNDNAPARRLRDIIAQSPRDRVERQRAISKPLDKFEAAHFLAPVGTDSAVGPAGGTHSHSFLVLWLDREHHASELACLAVFGRHHFLQNTATPPH